MSNYIEVSASGVIWKRCRWVDIENPLNGPRTIRFQEEDVVQMPDKTLTSLSGSCAATFSLSGEVPLLDPLTNLPTGEVISHAEIYRILHSVYIQTATARDDSAQSAADQQLLQL